MLMFFIFGRWGENAGASSPQERDQILCLRSANGPGWGLLLIFQPAGRPPPALPAPHPTPHCSPRALCSSCFCLRTWQFIETRLGHSQPWDLAQMPLRTYTNTRNLSLSTHRCIYMYVSMMYMSVCVYIYICVCVWIYIYIKSSFYS